MVFVHDRPGVALALATLPLAFAGLIGAWAFEHAPFLENPFWLGLFLGNLALAVAISLEKFVKLPAFHLCAVKATDVGMTAFFAALFLYGFVPWDFAHSFGFSTLAGLEIAAVALVIDKSDTDLKGLYWVLIAKR